ncbi:MAG: FAD-binding oxidoreductase [Chloroflexota bacterium]|nr:FAD-binding oxidoreductase [Chloroflexota bacterium]
MRRLPRLERETRAGLQHQLLDMFGMRFQPAERGPLGTVRPLDEAELRRLAVLASREDIPLVPAGAGSSPYGGAAARAGLQVSFEQLNQVLELEAEQQTIAVEPGATWQSVIDVSRRFGLMPQVYPSSRAFATVGGFVAQGGVGVGSYAFGSIEHQVVRLRLINLAGEAEELDGAAVGLGVGAEGRTGLLSAVTLRLQPFSEMRDVVGLFDRAAALEESLRRCAEDRLPLWSIAIIDPAVAGMHSRMGGLRQPVLELGHYAALFSFRAAAALNEPLWSVIERCGGHISTAQASHDAWVDRFMGFQVLRTTRVPMQFFIPASALAELLRHLPAAVRESAGCEGVVVDGGAEVVVRFLLLHQPMLVERNWEMAARLLELVRGLGGRSYSTGGFFLEEAEVTYGRDRLNRLRTFHQRQDPKDLLNPGKAFAS